MQADLDAEAPGATVRNMHSLSLTAQEGRRRGDERLLRVRAPTDPGATKEPRLLRRGRLGVRAARRRNGEHRPDVERAGDRPRCPPRTRLRRQRGRRPGPGHQELPHRGNVTGFALERTGIAVRLRVDDSGDLLPGGHLGFTDAKDITVGTTTGARIGTGSAQKLGFFGATPIVRRAASASPTDLATVIALANAENAALRKQLRKQPRERARRRRVRPCFSRSLQCSAYCSWPRSGS